MAMRQNPEAMKVRLDKLRKKDPIGNARIIKKLERKIRKAL